MCFFCFFSLFSPSLSLSLSLFLEWTTHARAFLGGAGERARARLDGVCE